MVRVLFGLLKGALVGGLVAYAALRLSFVGTFWAYVACALAGALVGLVAGRAPWKAETIWTPVLKMVVGAGVGAGLAALGMRVLPDRSFNVNGLGPLSLASAPVLSVAVGLLYGLFVEIDDGGASTKDAKGRPEKKRA